MPAFLMQLVNSIKAVWARMSVMQRVMVMGGFVLIGSAAIALSVWASRPDLKGCIPTSAPKTPVLSSSRSRQTRLCTS